MYIVAINKCKDELYLIIYMVYFVFRIPHSLGYTKQPEDGLK